MFNQQILKKLLRDAFFFKNKCISIFSLTLALLLAKRPKKQCFDINI
jgi:hypothetical protein